MEKSTLSFIVIFIVLLILIILTPFLPLPEEIIIRLWGILFLSLLAVPTFCYYYFKESEKKKKN